MQNLLNSDRLLFSFIEGTIERVAQVLFRLKFCHLSHKQVIAKMNVNGVDRAKNTFQVYDCHHVTRVLMIDL
jgi:hypothetical protein